MTVELGAGLDRAGVPGNRPVVAQQIPDSLPPHPPPPHQVVCGTHLKGTGLRVTVDTVALVPGDAKIVLTDWLPPEGFDAERAEVDAARHELQAAWAALRSLPAELVAERRARVLATADGPRLDPDAADLAVERLREELRADDDAWMPIGIACEYAGVSKHARYAAVAAGRLQHGRTAQARTPPGGNSGRLLFKRSQIDAWLAGCS